MIPSFFFSYYKSKFCSKNFLCILKIFFRFVTNIAKISILDVVAGTEQFLTDVMLAWLFKNNLKFYFIYLFAYLFLTH